MFHDQREGVQVPRADVDREREQGPLEPQVEVQRGGDVPRAPIHARRTVLLLLVASSVFFLDSPRRHLLLGPCTEIAWIVLGLV